MGLNVMLIPFGLKDNKIYHVQNVPNGLACGCICPNCRKPLIAKNDGEVRGPYFSHGKNTECTDYQVMTYLHQYAQQLIESECRLVLPEFSKTPQITLKDGSILTGNLVRKEEIEAHFDNVKREFSWNQFRIDCCAKIQQRTLFIEITVTHQNSLEKIMAIEDANQSALEITLTNLHGSDNLYNDDAIKAEVFSPKNAKWIHHPRALAVYEQEYLKLKEKAEKRNRDIEARIKAKEAERLEAKEKERVNKEKERANKDNLERTRQRLRSELTTELSWLNGVTQTWINEYEKEKQKTIPLSLNEIDLHALDDLIGIESKGYWVFDSCCEHWQALLINQLYNIGMDRGISANEIKKFVINQSGINPYINSLNIAKYEAKQKTRAKNPLTSSRGAWYLSVEENNKIISPFVAVMEYLKYLARRGLLAQKANSSDFCLVDPNLRAYRARIKHGEELKILQVEEQKRLLREAVELEQRRRAITEETEQKRIKQLVESDRMVFEEHNGNGMRCPCCQFIFPHSADNNKNSQCPKCGRIGELKYEKITKEYLDSAFHRYRCSDRPRKSLVNFSLEQFNSSN